MGTKKRPELLGALKESNRGGRSAQRKKQRHFRESGPNDRYPTVKMPTPDAKELL
jgi:hypothetical protein